MAKAEKFATGGPFRLFVTVIWTIVPGEFPVSRGNIIASPAAPPKKRLKVTPEVVSALDRTNLSDREGDPPPPGCGFQLRINACFPKHTSSIQNDDQDGACGGHQDLLSKSSPNAEEPPLIVHWDGKLLPDLTGEGEGNLLDRLPIIVSSPALEKEKLLGMPKLPAGTGAAMATKVVEVLGEGGYQGEGGRYVFRHDASNTGIHTGCCRLLEEAFGETPSQPCLPPPRHRTNLAAAFKEGDGAILWTNDSVVQAFPGETVALHPS
ncbi:hypothetical protein GWK47_053151 [Chionoecetes opilio]|uniref:Uncharacterized protein n=1 Tax=Chionoecetes opilio TaxID=41210 RepID=A0A8J4Y7B8_CHIOP|nr:hypothetical protein GWK47_053151 [Chionoecetes opilio]